LQFALKRAPEGTFAFTPSDSVHSNSQASSSRSQPLQYSSFSMLVKQLRTCVAVPAATLRRPLSSPSALPQFGDRCSLRANRLVVAAGPKKKLKQQLQEQSQVQLTYKTHS